jgi:hypothetical protein
LSAFAGFFYGQLLKEVIKMTEKEKVVWDGGIMAENRARERERKSKPDIDVMAYEASKDKNVRISIQYGSGSKVVFAQVIQDNLQYLCANKVLKDYQKAMLLDLISLVQYSSNALVYPHPEPILRRPINLTEIAQFIGQSRKKVSEVVGSLIEMGIIYQVLTEEHTRQIAQTGNVRKERTLFINPEIIFSGNKNKIQAPIALIAAQNDILERNGHTLPIKMLLKPDAYAKLVKRETWSKYQDVASATLR